MELGQVIKTGIGLGFLALAGSVFAPKQTIRFFEENVLKQLHAPQ